MPLNDFGNLKHDLTVKEPSLNKKVFDAPPMDVEKFPFKTSPFKDQREALRVSGNARAFALLMDIGTGKTKVIIDNAVYLYLLGKIDTLLVIAPNMVHLNWLIEIDIHISDAINYASAAYESSMNEDQRAIWKFAFHYPKTSGLRILCFHTQSLSTSKGYDLFHDALYYRKCMMVLDESQDIKNPESKRCKALTKEGRRAPYKRILTGTPISQGIQDLYSQFAFLDPAIIGCRTFAEFRTEYLKMGGFYGRSVIGSQREGQLRLLIAPYSFEAKRTGLPEQVMIPAIDVELSQEQLIAYRDLREKFVVELEEGKLEEPLAVIRAMRLLQILSGHLPNKETGEMIELPCPRLDKWLMNLVQTKIDEHKIIIWAHYQHDIIRITRELRKRKIKTYNYYGGNTETRWEELQEFKSTGDKCVMVASLAAGGRGLTINEATVMIFYSHTWKVEARVQGLGRNWRTGQDKLTYVYDLLARGSVEDRIFRKYGDIAFLAKLFEDFSDLRGFIQDEL